MRGNKNERSFLRNPSPCFVAAEVTRRIPLPAAPLRPSPLRRAGLIPTCRDHPVPKPLCPPRYLSGYQTGWATRLGSRGWPLCFVAAEVTRRIPLPAGPIASKSVAAHRARPEPVRTILSRSRFVRLVTSAATKPDGLRGWIEQRRRAGRRWLRLARRTVELPEAVPKAFLQRMQARIPRNYGTAERPVTRRVHQLGANRVL